MKKAVKTGSFYGIGVGPGDPDLVTMKAVKALKKCTYVFEATSGRGKSSIAGRIAKRYYPKSTRYIPLLFPMVNDERTRSTAWRKNAGLVAGKLLAGHDCAFVTIGDPMIYSTCSYLLSELRKLIPGLKSEIVPGITSFQTAAAKSQIPLAEDLETLTVIPSFSSGISGKLRKSASDTIVLMKAFRTKREIASYAEKNRLDAIFASKMCMEGELVTTSMDEAAKAPEEYLSLFIIRKKRRNA